MVYCVSEQVEYLPGLLTVEALIALRCGHREHQGKAFADVIPKKFHFSSETPAKSELALRVAGNWPTTIRTPPSDATRQLKYLLV